MAPPSRQARRRESTRRKLIDAAKDLFASQGIDNTRIQAITEQADVGFGSFYNHFDGKEAIVAAVVEETARQAAEAIDAATREVEDPAEVVAIAHRSLIGHAQSDPGFGWLLVRLEQSQDLGFATLGPYAERDLERGIKAGRFQVEDRRVALVAAGGALLGVMRFVLEGHGKRSTPEHHTAAVLRMLGLTPEDALEVATRPLPDS